LLPCLRATRSAPFYDLQLEYTTSSGLHRAKPLVCVPCGNGLYKGDDKIKWPKYLVKRFGTGSRPRSRVSLAHHIPLNLLTSHSIVAVQGLGAHPFYTWVKTTPAPETVASKRQRLRERIRFWNDKTPPKDPKDGSREVMWPRDLLLPLFKNARVATYSYESDWKDPKVKTSLRQCADQFLNVLFQHRQHTNVSCMKIRTTSQLSLKQAQQ
jgi:hypothetical protein